ncbi:MAG: hypothetical protein F4236_06340, partial [Acidimicrobiia bacterium]|nr:hypothetical protein [Acidimicrobiia bacterium]
MRPATSTASCAAPSGRCRRFCAQPATGRWSWPTTTPSWTERLPTGPDWATTARAATCCFPVPGAGSCWARWSPTRRCDPPQNGCPTAADIAPGVVDARRCLAWLLQAAGDFPVEFREALGDRIYGCDDCQEVCPPNRRPESDTPDRPGDSAQDPTLDVLALLAAGDEDLMERYGRWYIPERDPRYLRRNALVVLGNVGCGGDPQVLETVQRYRRGDEEMLARHADW